MATGTGLKLKLMVDSKKNKVVFAEADKIFVDVLFKLLKLPMGSVVHLLANSDMQMEGGLANLYNSVTTSNYLTHPDHSKSFITSSPAPIGADSFLPKHEIQALDKSYHLYCCGYRSSCRQVAYNYGTTCSCGLLMQTTLPRASIVDEHPFLSNAKNNRKNGYVKDAMYMVTDDLKVIHSTALSCMSLLRDLNTSSDFSDLDEKIVDVPMEKILALMKASLQSSSTVLTDVFFEPTVLTDVFLLEETTVKTEPRNKKNIRYKRRSH